MQIGANHSTVVANAPFMTLRHAYTNTRLKHLLIGKQR